MRSPGRSRLQVADRAGLYSFRPGLDLRVTGNERALEHFEAEYRAVALGESRRAAVEIAFQRRLPPEHDELMVFGRHKTASWAVRLPAPNADPLRATIRVGGWPASFGLSLVQGYFVEPLLSIAAARTGHVLLPSAAIADGGGALLILGRSRSGKSSLSARALSSGRHVLGDDQILLDGSGRCWLFPRRLRFYSDLSRTAPEAFSRLALSTRAGLRLRGLARRLSRGYVSPPVRVAPSVLNSDVVLGPLEVERVAIVERSRTTDHVARVRCDLESTVAYALELLDEQRVKLVMGGGAAWAGALNEVRSREELLLRQALAGVSAELLRVPADWEAPRALDALFELLETVA